MIQLMGIINYIHSIDDNNMMIFARKINHALFQNPFKISRKTEKRNVSIWTRRWLCRMLYATYILFTIHSNTTLLNSCIAPAADILQDMNWVSVDFLSMLVVGALWGCTNPLLRKGSAEVTSSSSSSSSPSSSTCEKKDSFLASALKPFFGIKVWLPYVLNQSGSVVFYILLANSDISMAVPICNAMALLFSFVTSSLLGEPIEKPFRTVLGASLILTGVTICVSSQEQAEQEEKPVWSIICDRSTRTRNGCRSILHI